MAVGPDPMPAPGRGRWPAACGAALIAFGLYYSTLLPDFDLGDSASFQTMAGSPVITPRDGYPLYYAVLGVFTQVSPGSPARGANLASSAAAAAAVGVVVLVAAELSGSVLAGLAAALLFAGSYTFWSQAVVAEVYALHVLLTAATLLLALRWSRSPEPWRLRLFFAIYALAFGNHLSMILIAPALTVYLLTMAPGGWRSMFRPAVVTVAVAAAAAGALQYLWNLRGLWDAPVPPAGPREAFSALWFDVTKSDWRETMVLRVPAVMLGERLQMYAFDLRQQIGWAGVALAAAGAYRIAAVDRARTALALLIYLVPLLFALGYNVGDPHVFFLVPHLALTLLVAPAVAWIGGLVRRPWLPALLVIGLAGGRSVIDYAALDRSQDRRPAEVLGALTAGLDDRDAVLITDLNWQLQNGLTYFGQHVRRDLAYARMPEALLYLPALVRDNAAIGRRVVVTAHALEDARALYGPLIEAVADPQVPTPALFDVSRSIPAGSRYVLTFLRPSSDASLDRRDLADALDFLTGGALTSLPDVDYAVVSGLAGTAPVRTVAAARPFRTAFVLGDLPIEVRMDAWLAFDTIRRMGFGHVTSGRRPLLTIERGVSLVVLGPDAAVLRTEYRGNIFAPQPRFILRMGG